MADASILYIWDSDSRSEGYIRAYVHLTMLDNVLIGMYTVLYGGTMYLYISRDNPNRRVVIPTITVLYLFTCIPLIPNWYWFYQGMVIAGSTRRSMTLAILEPQSPAFKLSVIFNGFMFYSTYGVSDALLIWRCYHVWGRSLRTIAIPSLMFVIETCLAVVSTILTYWSNSNQVLTEIYDYIATALLPACLLTTLSTTLLIWYRIHKVARMGGFTLGSKSRVDYIMTIIMESAAIYSVALFGVFIVNTISFSTSVSNPNALLMVTYIMQGIGSVAPGIAPTILVARIALKDADTEQTLTVTTPRISELRLGPAPDAASA